MRYTYYLLSFSSSGIEELTVYYIILFPGGT
jgi:hypothetical protein